MAGHMHQRSRGVWALVAEGPRDPVTGKRRPIYRTVHGTKADARDELHRLLAEIADRKHHGRTGALADLIAEWIEVAGYEASTRDLATRDLEHYIRPTIGRKQVRRLTARDLTLYYHRLRAEGGKDGRALKAATVRRVHALIRRALGYGVEADWCTTNPAANARLPKDEDREEIVPPTPVELAQLFHAAASDPDWHAFLRLAAATGARRGELCGLRWSAIDLDAGTVTISRAVGQTTRGSYMKGTKTRQSRTVVVGPVTLEVLRQHRQTAEIRCARFAGRLEPDAFVFTGDPEGRVHWEPKTVTNRFIRTRDAAGLRKFRLHDLRHFTLSYLLDAGVPLAVVSATAGHSRQSTTTDIYSHPLDERLRTAGTTIDDVLRNA